MKLKLLAAAVSLGSLGCLTLIRANQAQTAQPFLPSAGCLSCHFRFPRLAIVSSTNSLLASISSRNSHPTPFTLIPETLDALSPVSPTRMPQPVVRQSLLNRHRPHPIGLSMLAARSITVDRSHRQPKSPETQLSSKAIHRRHRHPTRTATQQSLFAPRSAAAVVESRQTKPQTSNPIVVPTNKNPQSSAQTTPQSHILSGDTSSNNDTLETPIQRRFLPPPLQRIAANRPFLAPSEFARVRSSQIPKQPVKKEFSPDPASPSGTSADSFPKPNLPDPATNFLSQPELSQPEAQSPPSSRETIPLDPTGSDPLAFPTPTALEDQIDQLQQRLQNLEEVPSIPLYLSTPGISSNIPTAYGGSWGHVAVGFGFQERTRFSDESDGLGGVLVSFGDRQKAVGLDVGIIIRDTSEFDAGSFDFKVHRALPDDFSVAVGVENSLQWGDDSDADTSVYGVASKMVRLTPNSRDAFSRLYLTLGLGSGRFRTEDQIDDDTGSVGVFGGVAIKAAEPVHLFTEWTGQELNIGASIAPFRDFPLVITPAAADITGTAGDGVRFTLGFGYSFSF